MSSEDTYSLALYGQFTLTLRPQRSILISWYSEAGRNFWEWLGATAWAPILSCFHPYSYWCVHASSSCLQISDSYVSIPTGIMGSHLRWISRGAHRIRWNGPPTSIGRKNRSRYDWENRCRPGSGDLLFEADLRVVTLLMLSWVLNGGFFRGRGIKYVLVDCEDVTWSCQEVSETGR